MSDELKGKSTTEQYCVKLRGRIHRLKAVLTTEAGRQILSVLEKKVAEVEEWGKKAEDLYRRKKDIQWLTNRERKESEESN